MLVRCIVLSLDRFESQTEDVKGWSELINYAWLIEERLQVKPHLWTRRPEDPGQSVFLRNVPFFLQWWRYFLSAACSPTWPELRTGFPSSSD